ncbi:MAG: RNase H family protein, partial [Exilispira sp.]
RIYIDGSFNKETKKAGWAFCIVKDYQIIYEESNICDQFLDNTRQVIAEIYALYKAILWLTNNKYNEAEVYYDYSGVENWMTERWKVKNKEIESIIIKIKDQIEENKLKLKFVKVDAHSGDYYNEYVDKLARKATN